MHGTGNRQGVYDGKIAGLYDLEETLGSGHFAVVKLARHVFTGEKVAVKVIDKTKLDEVSRAHLFQEVRCMKLVQHPNVVRLYQVIDTQTKLYLILELGDGGDLYDYIMKHEGGLSENLAKEYFRQIVRAISYCHQLHVVHRDLKPENVVFFEKLGVVKLTDFGFSNKFCPGQKLETSCGSLAYSAPEILLGDSYDAPAVDVWSLGVILYMLVCGQPPFQEANDSETLTMIMDCKYTMPAHVSSGCRKLIGKMLVREPEKRSTLQQIAQDPWLIDGEIQDHGPELMPLVSREQVSEEDHNFIIQKMVNGNIATKEEILEALDRNEYNHITATYFLLAEIKLRAHRQEQAQQNKPELKLPISGTSRMNLSRNQQQLQTATIRENEESNSMLLPSTSSYLNIPRTPGAEGGQNTRIRKCSIVQEEDDEEELSSCSGREDISTPLNRRGSRSEGRLNIAIQDRIAESERLKKDVAQIAPITKIIDGIAGVKLISNDSCNTTERLGVAGRSGVTVGFGNSTTGLAARPLGDFRPRTAELNKILKTGKSTETEPTYNKNNLNNNLSNSSNNTAGNYFKNITDTTDNNTINTKFLVDSSTITIPLTSTTTNLNSSNVPKYKTMPSPTRPNTILTGTNSLNEIFEEGTDVGSSDTSATTTPRPITRQNHFINNRSQSQGSASTTHHHHSHHTAGGGTATSSQTRRSKFHKTRTTSCSSSDASDDDSENRKKRAHKIVDVAKPIIQYRRDSHDDSSDSQDPGNAATSSGTNSTTIIHITSTSTTESSSQRTGQQTTTTTTERQKTVQQISGFRRHRAGRRRAGETRLRESQSLNRITEVQESELTLSSLVQAIPLAQTSNLPSTATNTNVKTKSFSSRLFHGFRKSDQSTNNHHHNNHLHNNQHHNHNQNHNHQQSNTENQINKQHNHHHQQQQQHQKEQQSHSQNNQHDKPRVPLQTEPPDDDVEMVISAELAKALRVSENKTSTTNSTSKKLKILGKYFQVHKKLCIPGIFQRGRLYKAQSCGSIVRDKVNQTNTKNSTTDQTTTNSSTLRHSALFSDSKSRILRNCLGATRLLGSDGDINQNNHEQQNISKKEKSTQNNLFSISGGGGCTKTSTKTTTNTTGTTKNCSLTKQTSPIHHIGDNGLCSSKC